MPDDPTTPFGPRAGAQRPSPEPDAVRVGERVGPFTLVRFLARGGMGEVWEAWDTTLRRRVALKLVLPERVDERALELFTREARAGGRLAHKNIVATYGHGIDGGRAWIAQELVEGEWTLRDALDELRRTDVVPKDYYKSVARLVADLADALDAAHHAGVIHRDVKPQNILIAPDETPKLTDFGLARVSDDSFASMSGDFAGTYAYMSPEQVTAKRIGLDHRTDVFSLGVVLYELLTFRRPFEGDTTHQIAQQILFHDPPHATRIRSQCPRDLAAIAGMALEKEPTRRYACARDLALDLRCCVANKPVIARPPTPILRLRKWVFRHPATTSFLAAGSVLLAGLITVLVVAAAEREREAERKGVERWQSYVAAIRNAGVARSASEITALLKSAPENHRGWEWRLMWAQQDRSRWSRDSGAYLIAWSHDSRRVAGATADSSIGVWDAQTGDLVVSLRGFSGRIFHAGFSLDGTRLLASDGRVVYHWSLDDGALLGRRDEPVDNGFGSCFSTEFAASLNRANDSLVLWDPLTGRRTASFPLDLESTQDIGSHGTTTHIDWSADGRFLVVRGSRRAVVYDVATGERVASFDGSFSSINFSPDGSSIALIGSFTWSLVAIPTGKVIASGDGMHPVRVFGLPNGEVLIVEDGRLRLKWRDGDRSEVSTPHFGTAAAVVSPAGKQLAASDGGRLRIWDLDALDDTFILPTELCDASDAAIMNHNYLGFSFWHKTENLLRADKSGRIIVVASQKDAYVVRMDHSPSVALLWQNPAPLSYLDVSADGALAVAGWSEGSLEVWDLRLHERRFSRNLMTPLLDVALCADGVVALGESGRINAWRLDGTPRWARDVGPSSRYLAATTESIVVSSDTELHVIDSTNGSTQCLIRDSGSSDSGRSGVDGILVASGKAIWRQSSWDLGSGRRMATIPKGEALALSPDGATVAIMSSGGFVSLIHAATGAAVSQLRRTGNVGIEGRCPRGATFHPDGTRVCVWSADQTVTLWDVFTGTELASWGDWRAGEVLHARFSEDGTRLLILGRDRIQVLDAVPHSDRVRVH